MSEFFQFIFFAFAACVTPGPNNLMIMHSGLNFGLKKTIPAMLGILFGVSTMLLGISMGIGYAFEKLPSLRLTIKVIGSLYMLFLAWKITQMNEKKTVTVTKPLTFMKMALFQWINPKVWVSIIAYTGIFHVSSVFYINALALIATITIINIPCLFIWLGFGRVLKRIINSEKQRNRMNYFLGSMLFVAIIILWI